MGGGGSIGLDVGGGGLGACSGLEELEAEVLRTGWGPETGPRLKAEPGEGVGDSTADRPLLADGDGG